MIETLDNPRVVLGNNAPPPIEAHRMDVEDLLDNARQFLDGAPVETQAQADSIGTLLDMLRQSRKAADEQRKVEAKPFDDGKAAVQALWKPLLDKIEVAERTAKTALGAFLKVEQARKDAEAAEARRIAQEAADKARREIGDANAGADLAARERAEETIAEAEALAKAAKKLDGARASVAGGARAVSLRSVWTATMADPVEALKHYRSTQPSALKAWLSDQADADVRSGLRSIPGFEITESKVAV